MRIRKIKKIVVLLIIMAMLQTQIVSLSNIAWAINMEMTGETGVEEGLVTETVGEVNTETTVTEEVLDESSNEVSEEVPNENLEESSEELPEENLEEVPEELPEENLEEVPEELPEENPEEVLEENPEVNEETIVEPKVELNITSENSSIYKGYLYANATSDLRYETNYNTIDEVKIEGSKNGISSLVVKEEEDKIKMITGTKMALFNDIYYKKTRVSTQEFQDILGENGLINIFDASGDFVGYIDSESPEVNGYYEFEFIYYTNSVTFELSSPIADGTIKIINDKAIKEDSLYSREQIVTFSSINVMANVEMTVGDIVLTASGEGDINLQETESKIEMELDKTDLSTEDVNELTMTLTLKTDAERYELFKNPVMEVEMPSNINELSIEGINLLYKNGLSLKNWEVVENDSGNKVLRVELEGAQSVYTPGIVQQGTTLVIYLKANVNKLTANTSETMKLRYTNQDSVRQSYVLEGKDAEEILITFVAKHGMLKGMVATNNTTLLVGNSYEDKVDKLEIKSNVKEQKVTLKGTVVNNFEKEVNDVVIIGRIPFVGNKNGSGEELLSDFDTMLSSEVLTTGNLTEIYYSEDGDATIDSESWTQDVTDMTKYKSYKIVVKEGTLKKGEKVEFTYDVITPENLGYNLKSYATYTVIYKLDNQELSGNCTIALVTEEKELEADDMEQQEEVEKLKIGTQVTQGGRILTEEDSVFERQMLRYTVVVTNTSKQTLTNVKLTGRAENANLYYMIVEKLNYNTAEDSMTYRYEEDVNGKKIFDEMLIESLAPGESKTFSYQVVTKELTTENQMVYGVISVSADNLEENVIETTKNQVKDGKIEMKIIWGATESVEEKDALTNEPLEFAVFMKNITDSKLENIILNVELPKEVTFNIETDVYGSTGLKRTYVENAEGGLLTFDVSSLEAGESKELYIPVRVKNVDYNIENIKVELRAYAQVGEERYYSNDFSKVVWQSETKINYKWYSNNKAETINHEEQVIYTLELSNDGIVDATVVEILNKIPAGLEIEKVILIDNAETENEIESTNNVFVRTSIGAGESIKLIITTKINENKFLRDQESIDNKVTVSGGTFDEFETDVISYKIINSNVTVTLPEVDTNNSNNDNTENEENNNNNTGNEENNNTTENEENNNTTENEESNNNTNTQNPENQINSTPEKEEIIKTYMISGKVWLDKNKDGINRDESGMQSVVVMLYKTTDKGNITTMVQQQVTDSNGEYKFTSVEEGNYVVVFSYDTGLYNSTKYHVSTADTSENSDAITKAIIIENSKDIYGITDMITISGAGAINVDLGLVSKNEFDLSLEKYVASVTVTNKEGEKLYNYKEENNVKLEIHSKYFKDSQIDITYKIRVKNSGEVIGYINKLVDYVPDDMKFDNNKNPEWYYGDDGNLYYKGLVGREINPGETKEVTLVLTKVLDKGEAVKIVNGAEIAESTNSIGLTDIDSTPGNKQKSEDDYGEVTLMVTISTGSTTRNMTLLIITLLIIITIVYIAKFKTTKKVYR